MSPAVTPTTRDMEWYRTRSLWLDQSLSRERLRASVQTDLDVDVAIIGGGLIGIWTAYSLARDAPHLRIAVIEKEIVGFGAAGRNGGWAGAGLAGSPGRFARRSGWTAVRDGAALFREAVDDIGRVVAEERIDCAYVKAGTLTVATNGPQAARLASSFAGARADGLAGDGDRQLSKEEVAGLVKVAGAPGGAFTPDCARIHPSNLVRGLADAAERRGVQIFEHTEVTGFRSGAAVTAGGVVRAAHIIIATEAWTPLLKGGLLTSLPLTSMMIATEPLPKGFWDEVGWPHGLTVRDKSHLFFYAHRTADDRIAIGGRGSPYRLSRPYEEFGERDTPVWERLERTLKDLFPAARESRITHRWGGALAVPRDWSMSVNRSAEGRIRVGGLAGHGVVAAHVAGRTVADLVLERSTWRTAMPWVGHRSRRWEPEPVRAFAANAIVGLLAGADAYENRTDRPARRAQLVAPFMPPA